MCATSYFLVRFLYINYNNNIPPSLLPPLAFLTRMRAEHRCGRGFHHLRSESRSKKGHGVFPLPNEPRVSIARAPQPMGGQGAESYYGASSGGGPPRRHDTPPKMHRPIGRRVAKEEIALTSRGVEEMTRGRQTVVGTCGSSGLRQWWSWFKRSAVL